MSNTSLERLTSMDLKTLYDFITLLGWRVIDPARPWFDDEQLIVVADQQGVPYAFESKYVLAVYLAHELETTVVEEPR